MPAPALSLTDGAQPTAKMDAHGNVHRPRRSPETDAWMDSKDPWSTYAAGQTPGASGGARPDGERREPDHPVHEAMPQMMSMNIQFTQEEEEMTPGRAQEEMPKEEETLNLPLASLLHPANAAPAAPSAILRMKMSCAHEAFL